MSADWRRVRGLNPEAKAKSSRATTLAINHELRIFPHVLRRGDRVTVAGAELPQWLKTQLNVTAGYGADMVDAFQLAQRHLKDSAIEAELKLQEYGAYMSTTFLCKYEGLAMGPLRKLACCEVSRRATSIVTTRERAIRGGVGAAAG